MRGLRLPPGSNRLGLSYTALSFTAGEQTRFQHRMDEGEWSAPDRSRALLLANLAPGRYRLEVRAVSAGGEVSPEPARAEFVVIPPLWRQPWFLALALMLLSAAAVVAYRARVGHLLAVERVRTRLASDLHDDIGAGLSQIAITSEVVRQRLRDVAPELEKPLKSIASTSRELVDAMSDIVWSMNPGRDTAPDLVYRMRRFASDTLSGCGIDLVFTTDFREEDRHLGPRLRREVLLVFKELIHNAARHSQAARVEVELAGRDGKLLLRVCDDGRGLAPAASTSGHGLSSMRRRAADLGGTLHLRTRPEGGTEGILTVPLPT